MHGLTLFAEALVANPWLRKDPTWLDFMSSALPPSGPKKGQESVKTPSEQMLQNILDRLPIPSTPLERIYELKDEITAIEKQCKSIFQKFFCLYFIYKLTSIFISVFSTSYFRCNTCCSKTTSCFKCSKSIFTCSI